MEKKIYWFVQKPSSMPIREFIDQINELGAKGWRLVTVAMTDNMPVAYLENEKK